MRCKSFGGIALASLTSLALVCALPPTAQQPFLPSSDLVPGIHGAEHDLLKPPLPGMRIREMAVSGPARNRVNIVFFGDGYTQDEQDKFFNDAQDLTHDLVREKGAFALVRPMINLWAVFVPSNESGIGDHDTPRGTPFGLYRPGPELRGVYYAHPERVTRACAYLRGGGRVERAARVGGEVGGGDGDGEGWRGGTEGWAAGCDEPVLLGNDPLYGGLGGTPTVITASKINGPMVLRHELGHTLIPVGEEYDGGYVYAGVDAAPVSALENGTLPWMHWLSRPPAPGERVRMEDVQVPLQAYPWHNLSTSPWTAVFNATNGTYPTALLRFSLSSIPFPSHLTLTLAGVPVSFELFPTSRGSRDRAWVEVPLPRGLEGVLGEEKAREEIEVQVQLSREGEEAKEGQGGKMITSFEMIEYGSEERYNGTSGFIGAFPTYAEDGSVTLRPLNEECLMRRVTFPTFCSVCLEGLILSLAKRISLIDRVSLSCPSQQLKVELVPLAGKYDVRWQHNGRHRAELDGELEVDTKGKEGLWEVDVALEMVQVRLTGARQMRASNHIWVGGC